MNEKNMNKQFTCPPFQPPKVLYNNLGNHVVQEGGKETSIKIDSKDRDIDVYPDPFSFRVVFNPIAKSTPKPYCDRVLDRVKSVRLEYLTLPMTTNFALQSSGLITMGWNEFNAMFSEIDDLITLVPNSDGRLVIRAEQKDEDGILIRNNQILFKALEVNDRLIVFYHDGDGNVDIEFDIEQMDYDDDHYFIVSQQTVETNGALTLSSIQKSLTNEKLELDDDYHNSIVTIINNKKHIGSILSVHDTIKLSNRYFYIKKIIGPSRLLLNDVLERPLVETEWTNVKILVDDYNITIKRKTNDDDFTSEDKYDPYDELFYSNGSLKIQKGYGITISDGINVISTFVSSTFNNVITLLGSNWISGTPSEPILYATISITNNYQRWENISVTINSNQITFQNPYHEFFNFSPGYWIRIKNEDGVDTVDTIIESTEDSSSSPSYTESFKVRNIDFTATSVTIIVYKFEELKTYSAVSDASLVNQRYISLKIKELQPSVLATNDVVTNSFAILHTERYGNGNIMVYPNADISFDQQSLRSLHTMTFEFYDEDGKQITCDFSEYFNNKDIYDSDAEAERLLIHPRNKHFQIFMSFKAVTIEQTLDKNNFC